MDAIVLATANAKAHDLRKILWEMGDEEFAQYAKTNWWTVLGVREEDVPAGGKRTNVIKTVQKLRDVFTDPANKSLVCTGPQWIEALLNGTLLCALCHKKNASHGIVKAAVDKVKRHMDGKSPHGDAVAWQERQIRELQPQQPKIYDVAGGAEHDAAIAAKKQAGRDHLALVTCSIVAGGSGAAGVKTSSVPKLLDQRMLALLATLRGGFPVPSTLRARVLPDGVQLLKERFKKELAGVDVNIALDGGSCHKAGGLKVIALVASSLVPLRSGSVRHDRLLRVVVMRDHETGKSLANIVDSVCQEYGILKEKLLYMVADNASVNAAAFKELQSMGYRLRYARCLPHTLALVLKAFLDVFDKALKLSTHMKEFRGFLTAGGGRGRRGLALEHGIKCCKIDFCETRWASFLKALLAVANLQKADDLKAARKELEALHAESPSDELAAVLAEPDVPRMLFNVIYEFLEAISESDLVARKNASDEINGAEADLPKLRKRLLKFFSSLNVFAGLQVIDIVLGGNKATGATSMPTLMTLTQGAAGYAAKLKNSATGHVPDATQASRSMMSMLKGLLWEVRWGAYAWPLVLEDAEDVEDPERGEKLLVIEKLEGVEKELRLRLRAQADAVVANSRASEEPLVQGAESFHEDQIPSFFETMEGLWAKVVPYTMGVLQDACVAVDAAAGLKKLEECVSALEVSSVFSLNVRPRSFKSAPGLAKHLGCEGAAPSSVAAIKEGWEAYVAGWQKPKEEVSPHEVRFPSASIIASFLRMTSYPPSHRPLTRRRFPCGGTCSTTA